MFKNNLEEKADGVDTIIGPSVSVEGNFSGNGNIIIEGEVKGSLQTKGYISASETSNILADISAGSAEIAGKVTGNIKVKDNLEIKETAQIDGDIDTGTVAIAYGAILNGKIKMKGGKTNESSRPQMEEEIEENK